MSDTKIPKNETNDEPVVYGHWLPEVPRWNWWNQFWTRFWAIPLALSISAIAAGLVIPQIDRAVGQSLPFLFEGGPDGARSVLTTISSAMISVTGLVFSVTMVVLQLASNQFTPRILESFLEERITQITLGVFAGTFLYALTVLRCVHSETDTDTGFVPQIATSLAFLSVIVSVGFFLAFIHHITTSIRVTNVIRDLSRRTINTMDCMIPGGSTIQPRQGAREWNPPRDGAVTPIVLEQADDRLSDIDYPYLVKLAETLDTAIELTTQVGSYIGAGTQVGVVYAEVDEAVMTKIRKGLVLSPQRSLRQDIGFGIRQLVDIASRALSPGINDPLTAVEAINALHTILIRAVTRQTPVPYVTDKAGTIRLVYRPQTADELVELAVTEIAVWGAGAVIVPEQLRRMLEILHGVAREEYRDTLNRMTELVNELDETPGHARATNPAEK